VRQACNETLPHYTFRDSYLITQVLVRQQLAPNMPITTRRRDLSQALSVRTHLELVHLISLSKMPPKPTFHILEGLQPFSCVTLW
jgi:uncharacterized protein YfaT (DUF1175 family)